MALDMMQLHHGNDVITTESAKNQSTWGTVAECTRNRQAASMINLPVLPPTLN
jgi:hypothetical protein